MFHAQKKPSIRALRRQLTLTADLVREFDPKLSAEIHDAADELLYGSASRSLMKRIQALCERVEREV